MEPAQAPPLAAGPAGLPDGGFVMVEWVDPGGGFRVGREHASELLTS